MPTIAETARGRANIYGVKGVFSTNFVIASKQALSVKVTGDEVKQKDNMGFTSGIRITDLGYEADVTLLLEGTSYSEAKTSGNYVIPLATVSIATGDLSVLTGTWQLMLGQSWDLKNDQATTMKVQLRRWDDSGQNALLVSTTPS
jgi:hypothetical protein